MHRVWLLVLKLCLCRRRSPRRWLLKMRAVIVEGNPKYIANNPLATAYYDDIEKFLKQNGVSTVLRDPGADYTCPPKADLYIGHSRGAGRARCMSKGEEYRFLKFGDPDGVIHPDDAKWQASRGKPGVPDEPPACHYEFISAQRTAIVALIRELKSPKARMLT